MTELAFFHWNLDPEIVRWGPLAPRWYGSFFALGFFISYFLGLKIWRREKRDETELSNLFIYIFLGTIIGARLGHCLFYDFGHYLYHPLEIFKIWEGGLASHGGALGVLTALALYARRYKVSFIWLADRGGAVIPLTAGLIRLGNFFNSEILGKETTLPWGLVFERFDDKVRHPAQLYEALVYFVTFALIFAQWNKRAEKTPPGLLVGQAFILIFASRFLFEFIKENQEPFESSLPLNMGQLLSIPFVVIGLWLVNRAKRQDKSASVSA